MDGFGIVILILIVIGLVALILRAYKRAREEREIPIHEITIKGKMYEVYGEQPNIGDLCIKIDNQEPFVYRGVGDALKIVPVEEID